MAAFKKYFFAVISVLVLLFILQNTETTVVSFLFYEVSMPRALLITVVLIIGIIIGVFLPFELKLNKMSKSEQD